MSGRSGTCLSFWLRSCCLLCQSQRPAPRNYVLLTVFIVISTINVVAEKAFAKTLLFVQAQASLMVIALSAGFLSYYLYYVPGEGRMEWLHVSAVLFLNGGFFHLGLAVQRTIGRI